jgi:hypothetical protein
VGQDILALADRGKAADVASVQVLVTWFQGRRIYRRPSQ